MTLSLQHYMKDVDVNSDRVKVACTYPTLSELKMRNLVYLIDSLYRDILQLQHISKL